MGGRFKYYSHRIVKHGVRKLTNDRLNIELA